MGRGKPHAHDHVDEEGAGNAAPPRRVDITLKDLQRHGYTDGCPRCACHKELNHRRARVHKHTEACRERLYRCLRASGSDEIRLADEARTRIRHSEPRAPAPDQDQPPAPSPSEHVPDDPEDEHLFSPDPDDST